MADILARICADKREHLAWCKTERPLSVLEAEAGRAGAVRGFLAALRRARENDRYGLICEIKRASPSKGLIREDFAPDILARGYAEGGATCLSVLTDRPYFQGDDAHLRAARKAVDLPVLRKDFMLEPYQIVESRALGADCVLLILAVLSDAQAGELAATAREWGMDILVEVHDRDELGRACALGADMIGINNRNLKSFAVSIETTLKLAGDVPDDCLVIAESGLYSRADLDRCAAAGVTSFLIGEALMRQDDVTVATRQLTDPCDE